MPSTDNQLDPRLTRQHFSTKIFKVYLKCIEIHHPHVDVRKVCDQAGLPYAYIMDVHNWVSVLFDREFCRICNEATGDPALPYKAGQISLTPDGMGNLLYHLIRNTLSTTRVYRTITAQVLNFSKVMKMEIVSSGKNYFHFKYAPDNLESLSPDEKEALRESLDHIYQNTIGYIETVPRIHDSPEATVKAVRTEGLNRFQELHMHVYFHDRKPLRRLLWSGLAVSSLIAVVAGLLHFQPDGFLLSPLGVKSLLFALFGLAAAGLYQIFLSAKLRRIPEEAQKTIEKMDRQYKDLQQAKEKIEDMNVSLRKSDQLKDEFLSNTSHELRTPLNGIIGIAESLIDGAAGGLSQTAADNLSIIVRSGRRLANLVDGILDYAKLKNRDVVLEQTHVDLKQLTDVVFQIVSPLTAGKDLRLENRVAADFPLVLGDEDRLNQILLNLLDNSIKFSSKGVIFVAAKVEGSNAQIKVSDPGIGIVPDKQADIFKSFEQADGSIEREYGGTGLGLSVTKSLVEYHGGRIWVESEPEKGSTFFFTLPLAVGAADGDQPDPADIRKRQSKALLPTAAAIVKEAPVSGFAVSLPDAPVKPVFAEADDTGQANPETIPVQNLEGVFILAVDDDPVNIQVIKNNLSLAGAVVRDAASGLEALEIMEQQKPDIVLLDIMMPKMNGYETARRIRSRYSPEELPVIFLSAKNQVKDLLSGFSSGGSDYLSKPLSKNELLARIRFHVGLSRSRAALEKAERKYRNILKNIEESYFELDIKGHLTFFNDSLSRMSGYDGSWLRSRYYRSLIAPSSIPVIRQAIRKIYQDGKPIKGMTLRMINRDGELFPVEASFTLIKDADGRGIGVRGLARDISDRLEKEHAEKERQVAEASTRAKSEFLARMSHEIRTPMNAIIGFSHLALQMEDFQRQKDYLRKINSSGKALLGIINDILDFSKIEAGRMELEKAPFNLQDVLENVTDIFSDSLAGKNLEYMVVVEPQVPWCLVGDSLRLGQILINLVGNALKFTEKGEIRLTISAIDEPTEQFRLQFTVADTGIGVSPEQKEKLFSSFMQADTSTTRHYGGTGLGLTISKNLVEMMKGTIDLTSTPGKGTAFTFTACFDKPGAGTGTIPTLPETVTRQAVLVIDEKIPARDYLVHLVTRIGFGRIDTCLPTETIPVLKRRSETGQPYGMVLMDWRVDGAYNALQLTRQAQDEADMTQTAILLTTFFRRAEDMRLAEQAGARGIIQKPLTQARLYQEVSRIFSIQEDLPAGQADTENQVTTFSGKTVLLVEDNPLNREIAVEMLQGAGLLVEVAHNGRDAVAWLHQNRVDLVLMDIQMPEMDGYEATRRIRKDSRLKDLPIVAMTANTLDEDKKQCYECGMNDIVFKPIEPEDLVDALFRWIGRAGGSKDKRETASFRMVVEPDKFVTPQRPVGRLLDTADGIRRCNHKKSIYLRILQTFMEAYQNFVQEFKACCAGDTEDSIRMAHTLKGLAGNIAAADLYRRAAALEAALRDGEGDVESLLRPVEDALTAVFTEIRTILQEEEGIDKNASTGNTPASPEKVARLVSELKQHLADSSFQAEKCVEDLKKHLENHNMATEIILLKDQISRQDFRNAEQTLRGIEKELLPQSSLVPAVE